MNDFHDHVIQIIIALASSGTLIVLGKWLWSIICPRLKEGGWNVRKRFLKYLETQVEIQNIFNELIEDLNSDRVILLASHNGGSTPSIQKPFYSSSILQDFRQSRIHDIPIYTNISIDAHYKRMLIQLMEEDHVTIDVGQLPQSLLKGIYEAEGIQHSFLVGIGLFQKQYLYLSVSRLDDKPFTESERNQISMKGNAISNILGINNR